MYTVDFLVQIVRLLPNRWRKPAMIAWLYRCIAPVQALHSQFVGYQNSTLRRMRVTAQTYSLEWLLNFLFNPGFVPDMTNNSIDYTNGGIWIENNPLQLPMVYLFSDYDMQPPLYVYSESDPEYPTSYIYAWTNYWEQYHFVVHVPASISIVESYMRAIINQYNVAGRRYIIQVY